MRGVDQVGWLRTKGFIAALLNGHHQISPLRPMSRGEFDFISQIIGQAESTIITREPSTARFFNSHLIGKWFDPSHNFIKVALLHGLVLVCALENHFSNLMADNRDARSVISVFF